MGYHLKLTLSYKSSLTDEVSISSFGATMVLLYLLTLALLVQTTTQESQEWRDEQKSFEQKAKNFFKRKLPDLKILDFRFSGFDKCPHKAARNPYGVAKLRLRVSCPHGIPANCGLYSTRHDRTEVLVVDCQYAGEVTSYGHGRILAALCYQNTTRGIRRIGEEIAAEGLCKKWRYPGTELPQLEVPEHLKSPHSSLLLYQVANSESFSGPYSPETAAHWPRNPYERTGFGGKGKLEEYGANMALYLLITRYSYGTTKVLIEDSDNSTALPRFWVKKDKIDADLIKRKVSKLTKYCKGSEINLMVKTRQKYHTGYLKNKHNTDNAWLEGAIIHLHDQSDQGCFGPYPVHADVQSRQYRWQVLSDSTTPRDFALTFAAMQDSQQWRDARNTFEHTVKNFFTTRLPSIQILHVHFTEFAICQRNDSKPYGLSNLSLKVLCPAGQLYQCRLYSTRDDGMEILTVDCQFAAEITTSGHATVLAALCYQNTTTGSRSGKGEIPAKVLCKKWSYPGTELPQLQLPGYLKSPESNVLFYTTASLELSGGYAAVNSDSACVMLDISGNSSESQNVDTSRWPRNIYEKTGFSGTGKLPRLGVNPALYLLVTRRSDETTEVFIENTDQRIDLPWFWVKESEADDDPTEQEESKPSTFCNMSEIYTMLQKGKQYYTGYLKNKHNTDNAWLQGLIIHVEDDTGGCFSQYPLHADAQSQQYRWQVLPNSTTPKDFALSFGIRSQATTQESQEWRDEQKSFEQKAKNFFKRKLPDLKILDYRFSGFDKCPHKAARNPYGVTKLRLRVSCPHGIPANCGLYSTRHDRTEVLVVDCQYAGEVTSYGHGRILAALCYQNTTRGIRRIGEEVAAEGLCKKWRYPGTELPQLEVPEHLKSPHSSLLLYQAANTESFSGPYSPETAASWPKNPYERTGFGGKGKLEEYGANMALYLLITRYSYGTTKVLIEDSDNSTALPRFWVKKDKIDADLIKRKVSKLTKYCKGSEINLMVKTRQKYHTGYLKNKHNTDNAWLEGAIIHLHDQSDQGCFGPYPVHADVQSRQYRWQVLSDSTTPRDFALTFVANYKQQRRNLKNGGMSKNRLSKKQKISSRENCQISRFWISVSQDLTSAHTKQPEIHTVSRNLDCANCGLYSTRHDRTEVLVVDCQYAGEVTSYGHGRILAALCYQNTTRGIRRIGEEIAAEGLCKKLRYPGTELPQLEVPEHLKSPHSSLLLYQVANTESFSGPYSPETAAHWPKNPYERTGFGGKGKLEEYGANMALYLLITRYSYGTTKVLIEDSDNSTALPRFWVKKDKIDADLIKRKVSKLTKYCKGSEINLMVKTRQKYHTGYLKNKHNTDNAWLEGAIIHLHDQSDDGCFTPYPVHADVQSRQYRWQVLSDSTTPRDFALTFVANYNKKVALLKKIPAAFIGQPQKLKESFRLIQN
ncbi:LOW QUALITY PROTEIN: hypothetical protein M514_13112 [Trichuris suis]|uniref:Uncharacterized protein n=1 Tax=Trichuris suis TaxID=68888 RepID=A0A085MVK9_9BILA|nr:LOW QUALITY PROTEIN: hypothetical protein M514_13112 [Trichuris suis]